MTREVKKIISMLLVITCLVGTLAACTTPNSNEDVTTTKKQEEITTEQPTTEYIYKGFKDAFAADSLFAKYFSNRTINPGDKIVINELCEQSLTPAERGKKVRRIIAMIYGTFYVEMAVDFFDKYAILGTGNYEFTYEENFVIEYEGDKPIKFEVVKEEDSMVYIDIYLLD